MKIFEFVFNPKKSQNRFFTTASFEPKTLKEKPKGSLYLVGELQHALEFQSTFLKKLGQTIRQDYYNSSLNTEAALRQALKKANIFLHNEAKQGNVDWLGNLHVVLLLLITVGERKKVLHVAKTGTAKAYLNRQGALIDLGKRLEDQEHKNVGKVFGNIITGSVRPNDNLCVLTKDMQQLFLKDRSLQTLTLLKDKKQLHEFFAARQKILKQVSGIVFQVFVEEEWPSLKNFLPKQKLMLPIFKTPLLSQKQFILLVLFFILLLLGKMLLD